MVSRPVWATSIYTLALSLLILCVALGAMMISNIMQPYYAMLGTPARQDTGKLDRLLSSKTSTRIYALMQRATNDIRGKQYDCAEQHIQEASALDPGNALFDYMNAVLCFASDDYTHMWKFIRIGNTSGKVRLHSSKRIAPDSWIYTEMHIIRQMTLVMSSSIATEDELWELVRMGNAIAMSEPADFDVCFIGLGIRELAAQRMQEMASIDGNTQVVQICRGLEEESHAAVKEYEEANCHNDYFKSKAAPAFLVTIESYRKNPRLKESLVIDDLERQSEIVHSLRKKVLRIAVNNVL